MFFQPKNLKSENNNPCFNILLHIQSIVCATVDSQCLEYLGYITLTKGRIAIEWNSFRMAWAYTILDSSLLVLQRNYFPISTKRLPNPIYCQTFHEIFPKLYDFLFKIVCSEKFLRYCHVFQQNTELDSFLRQTAKWALVLTLGLDTYKCKG